MKFSCKTQDFLQAIHLVSRAIGGQQTLPILGNILIQVEGKRCTLSATDLELSIITSFTASVENEGVITVPAKTLLNFAQYNSDPEVMMETMEGTQLKCTSPHAKTIIAGEQASEYPTITSVSKDVSFSLELEPLLKALSLTTFAAAKTTLRPVLSGVYVQVEKKNLVLVATDSYRLSEYSIELKKEIGDDISYIVPARVLDELKGIISGQKKGGEEGDDKKDSKAAAKGTVEVVLNEQQIELSVGNTRLLSRLIEGKFPDYKQIIPKEKTTNTSISLKDLLTTTKRMHHFAKEVNNNLLFDLGKDKIAMSTPQTQIGKDEAEFEASVEGSETKIALSSTYLLDFLAHLEASDINIELTDGMHPAVFKLPKEANFLHLIMPLRMQED